MCAHTSLPVPLGRGPDEGPSSLLLLRPRSWVRPLAAVLLALMGIVGACLLFVPWQQSVSGVGRVIVYSAMERPQNIEAEIPGRLLSWQVQEGQTVRQGELIAELSDLDSKFLDRNQLVRMREQRTALLERRAAAMTRAAALERQLASVGRSRGFALPTAGERAQQAEQRQRAAQESVTAAEQAYKAGRQVAVPGASERAQQAVERYRAAQEALTAAQQALRGTQDVGVPAAGERAQQAVERQRAAREALTAAEQSLLGAQEVNVPTAEAKFLQAQQRQVAAEQAVEAAEQARKTAGFNQTRIAELFSKGLRSKRDLELADLDQVRTDTDLQRAKTGVEVARRDVRVAQLDQDRARVDLTRARTEVERAKAALDIAARDTKVFALEQTRAQVDLERARTEVERARAAVEIARRDTGVARLEQNRAGIDVVRAATEVERAKAALNIAQRDSRVGDLDAAKVEADTDAAVNSAHASLASARETIASMTSDILKLEVDLENTRRRMNQRFVRAPRTGRIVRLTRVGAGETVKAGDVLAVLAPDSADQAVELTLSAFDAPLVNVGRPVRLQFAGWPALQFTGWPSAAVGTFAGRVAVIDAVDDGSGKYRIIVKPDTAAISERREDPWPDPQHLRPGAIATGWVMLDTVSLGYELWRQFNAFPPTVDRQTSAYGDEKDYDGDKGSDKAGKDAKAPEIKRKSKQ